MFMFLCEEKRYLDSKLYDKIVLFKNEFVENYKTKNFLYTKIAEVKNKERLSSQLLEIIKIATIKTQELKD